MYCAVADARGVVHGDDFLILGDHLAIATMSQLLEGEYEVKMTGCISLVGDADPSAPTGADPSAPQELQYLHRVIRAVPVRKLERWRSRQINDTST
eukprot:2185710-Amphidinium_carterae.3